MRQHMKKYNLTKEELENKLNEFAVAFFGGTNRKVVWHEPRQFPYIQHCKENAYDCAGEQKNYTKRDVLFIRMVKENIKYKNGKYRFDYTKIPYEKIPKTDQLLSDIPIDMMYKLFTQPLEYFMAT